MGASRNQLNKAHKTRFASKSSRNVHKVSSQDKHKSDGGIAKGAKAARLQRNKMMREQKRAAILKEKRTLSRPRVIVLLGLSACVNLDAVKEDILSLLSKEGKTTTFLVVPSSEYKLATTVLKAPHGDLVACRKMAKDADLLAFVASPNSLHEADDANSFIDSFGSQCLSEFKTLALPSTVMLIRDLPEDMKRKHEIKTMCMSMLAPKLPEDCEFYIADKKDELHKLASIILKEKRTSSPPRVIVLFGLSACVNLNAVEEDILSLLFEEGNTTTFPAVASSEYKLRTTVLKAPQGDLVACMEMAKVADLLAFVASPNSLHEADDTNSFIDSFGSQCLSVFKTLGLPSTVVLIRDLPKDMKKRHEIKKMCVSLLAPEFPEDCKFYHADKKDELHKFMWHFKELRLTAPHWRNQRSYLMAQKVEMEADNTSSSEKCTLVLTGYIRSHSLSVNQLVHIAGAGDFPLSKIELLRDPCPLNLRKGADLMDSENDTQVVTPDPKKQVPLVVENAPDILAGEQTFPTEAEMAEADRNCKDKKMKMKRLPRGISEYQAAWIVDDSNADYSDSEGENDCMVVDDGENDFPGQKLQNDFDFDDDQASLNLQNSDEEIETESVMMDGHNLTKEQIAEQIRKIKEEHAEDEEFPDEVDTPIDVAARKRFAKYRGVKSFRTSTWDPKEYLPPDYSRIFAFDNFVRTQKHAKALDMLQVKDGCIPAGSYAKLYIKDVSAGVASKLCTLSKRLPVIACGLLEHESKISVLHFSIKKHDSYDAPIKAKEELLFHVGFRQFTSRPMFSSDSINASTHKMERFLHAVRFSVASVYAPICFHSLPLIALKSQGEDKYPVVAAVGSLRSVDPDRIVLKKIILTGYPQRVSKTKATVRYMFHNPDDVRWFKPVEVWSKCGRRGRIIEPAGTHGAMKCIFNGILEQRDTVCMSMFKRSYPKWPQRWFPLNSGSD